MSAYFLYAMPNVTHSARVTYPNKIGLYERDVRDLFPIVTCFIKPMYSLGKNIPPYPKLIFFPL